MVLQVVLVLQEVLVHKVHKDFKDHKVQLVLQVVQVEQVLQELQVQQDLRDQQIVITKILMSVLQQHLIVLVQENGIVTIDFIVDQLEV
jgi:hypothetical protein